jgi:2-dehydro-3-deoxygluconokinase
VYFVHADPTGEREFVYARRGSTASELSAADVHDAAGARVIVASGITCALSRGAADAVYSAATSGARFVYDPNFRPRLTTPAQAATHLERLAPHAELVTPSCPQETNALLGLDDPAMAAQAVRGLGARAVAVTCGADGVWLAGGSTAVHLPAVAAPRIVDQTGAGDAFVGAVAARLAVGDALHDAVRLGMASASLALGSPGGCDVVPTLEQVRAHLRTSTVSA